MTAPVGCPGSAAEPNRTEPSLTTTKEETGLSAGVRGGTGLFAEVTADLARGVPDQAFGYTDVRFVLQRVSEEYARHGGHADLPREAGDGATGEWSPVAPGCPPMPFARPGGAREWPAGAG